MENITRFIADNVWVQIECEKMSGYVLFVLGLIWQTRFA